MTDRRERAQRRRLPRAERLEPRVLFSADAFGALLPPLDEPWDRRLEERLLERYGERAGTALADADGPGPAREPEVRADDPGALGAVPDAPAGPLGPGHLVFVDDAVPDAAALAETFAASGAEVVRVGAGEDGLLVLSRTLAERDGLDAVHVLSHGRSGALTLGATTLDVETLAANDAGVARWADALAPGADLLLYGCEVGAGERGAAFVERLAALSGADVAASDDPTGHASRGADWTLERAVGEVATLGLERAFDAEGWRHALADIVVTRASDAFAIPEGTTMDELIALQAGGHQVTLREAVYAARFGAGADTITLPGASYELTLPGPLEDAGRTGDLDVHDALAIVGAGSGATSIVGAAGDRLLDVNAGGALALEGLRLSGGDTSAYGGGGIRVEAGASLSARDVAIDANRTTEEGGGIYNAGSVTLESSSVSDNDAGKDGGGVHNASGAELLLVDTVVARNESFNEHGGGIHTVAAFAADGTTPALVVRDSRVEDNEAAKSGGGIYAGVGAELLIVGTSVEGNVAESGGGVHADALTIEDSTVADNRAVKSGGGLHARGDVSVRDVVFTDNTAETRGGGAHVEGVLTMTGGAFSSNEAVAEYGGGLYTSGGASLDGVTFTANRAAIDGGAIEAGGALGVTASRFVGNVAGDDGGAVSAYDPVSFGDVQLEGNVAAHDGGAVMLRQGGDFERTTFAGNVAVNKGGAIQHRDGGQLDLTAVTFSANDGGRGGALHLEGDATIVNATFVDNVDRERAGAISVSGGGPVVRVGNSVFAGNTSAGAAESVDGDVASDGFNVFSDTPDALDIALAPTDRAGLDPRLGPLESGGGVAEVHRPDTGSPLIDAGGGVAHTSDASGGAIDQIPDIGAAEHRGAGEVVYVVDASNRILRLDGELAHVQVLLQRPGAIEHLAVDVDRGRLYWLEEGGTKFVHAALDGGDLQRLNITAGAATALALDRVGGQALVAFGGPAARIARVSLDDLTGPTESVVSAGIGAVTAMTVHGSGAAGDPVRVYWIEQGDADVERSIRSASAVDGGDPRVHVDAANGGAGFSSASPSDLAVGDGGLYWSDAERDLIGHVDLASGGVTLASAGADADPRAVAVPDGGGRVLVSTDADDRLGLRGPDLGTTLASVALGAEVRDVATFATADTSAPPVAGVAGPLALDEGATAVLAGLAASDDVTPEASLLWHVATPPVAGQVERVGEPGVAVTIFTHAEYLAGDVVYRHDGGETRADAIALELDDGARRAAPVTLAIEVSPVNDAPLLVGAISPQTAVSGVPFSLTVDPALWSDPDAGDALILSVTRAGGLPLPPWLVFDPASGTLSGTPGDADAGRLDLEARASDTGGASGASAAFALEIVIGNAAPTGVALDNDTVDENAPGASIGRLLASDPNPGDTASFAIDDPRFVLAGETLALAPGVALDAETEPSVTIDVVATDEAGASATLPVTVLVRDVNEAPTSIALDNLAVPENAPGSAVGRLSVSDPDAGDAFGFAVDDARFVVVGGTLALAPGIALDAESEPRVRVEVTATDGGGESVSATFEVAVGDVDEPPGPIALDNLTVLENVPGAAIGRLSSSDPDAGDAVSFAVDDPRFVVEGGTLALAAGVALDFEREPSVDVEVEARDADGLSRRDTLTIRVFDVNDAPRLLAAPVPPPLGPDDAWRVPDGTFGDEDGDALALSITASGPGAVLPAWLAFDAATATFSIAASAAAASGGADDVATVLLFASDGAGGIAMAELELRREPPPEGLPDRASLVEGGAAAALDGGATTLLANDLVDPAREPARVELVTGPRNGTLELAADGRFRYTHDGGESRDDAFSYLVRDASGAVSAPVEVTLAIAPTNDAPLTLGSVAAQRAVEDEPFALVIGRDMWSDPDAGDTLTLALVRADGGALPEWLSFDPLTGRLAGTPGAGDVGTLALRVEARDAAGASAAPLTFAVEIERAYRAPAGLTLDAAGVAENAPGAPIGRLAASVGSAEVRFATDDPRFVIEGDRLALAPGVALDFETEARVTLEVALVDGRGAGGVERLEIAVLDANDAPRAGTPPSPLTLAPGAPFVVPGTLFTDADGDALSYRATTVDGGALPAWLAFDAAAPAFTVLERPATDAPATVAIGDAVTVRLYASDGRGGESAVELEIRRAPELAPAGPEPPEPPGPTAPPEPAELVEVVPGTAERAPRESEPSAEPSPVESSASGEVVPDATTFASPTDRVELDIVTVDLEALIGASTAVDALELARLDEGIAGPTARESGRLDALDVDTVDLGALIGEPEPAVQRTFVELAGALERERESLERGASLAQTLVGGSAGLTSGLSIGYLIWLLRGGTLMGSVLSSLPAWRFVDPLPVLGTLGDGAEGDDESLESIVANERASPGERAASPDDGDRVDGARDASGGP